MPIKESEIIGDNLQKLFLMLNSELRNQNYLKFCVFKEKLQKITYIALVAAVINFGPTETFLFSQN